MEPRDLLLFGGWLVAGLVLPDLDQAIPLLAHRSGLTHSVLLPLLVRWRLGATAGAGAFAGVAIALAEDLFPRAYRGFALIHLPGLGSIGLMTIPWLLANMAASLGLGLHALRNVPRRSTGSYAVVALFALASVAYLLVHKANPGAFVLLWLTAMSLLLLARKRAAWRQQPARSERRNPVDGHLPLPEAVARADRSRARPATVRRRHDLR